jgi:nucleoside phosphorylase
VVSRLTARSNLPALGDTNHTIEALRPQIIILVGIAGGLCDDGQPRDQIALGDVVIGEYVSYVDFLKITDDKLFMRHYAIDYPSIALVRDLGQAISADQTKQIHIQSPAGNDKFKVHLGEIVASEKLMGAINDPLQIALLKPFDKALAVDMESIGVARGVCESRRSFWYHPRYVIIRGISDLVGQADNHNVRAQWKVFAAATAAKVAREFVDNLPEDSPDSA